MLTEEETTLIGMVGEVWNRFNRLEEVHPADQAEMAFYTHAIQNIILSRSGIRVIQKAQAAANRADLSAKQKDRQGPRSVEDAEADRYERHGEDR